MITFVTLIVIILEDKIRVVAVNYLNAKPLIKGIVQHEVLNEIVLTTAYPAQAAQMLIDGAADMGLVPVATIPKIPNAQIVGNYGIAADGKVASVCIFSHVPIDEVTHIFLDYQSRTSVKLAQLLMKLHFKKEVCFIPASEQYISQIKGTVAGVIIGDRALAHLGDFPYIYDLAEEWKQMTGLPFVFAAWIANKPLSEQFIASFDAANELGIAFIDHVVAEHPYPYYDLKKYYTEDIQFRIEQQHQEGLALYLSLLETYKDDLI